MASGSDGAYTRDMKVKDKTSGARTSSAPESELGALALVLLAAAFLISPPYHSLWAMDASPVAPAAEPVQPPVSTVKASEKARVRIASNKKAAPVSTDIERKKLRGARLRERGEALGGGTPEKD
jgi:hypothetical protein